MLEMISPVNRKRILQLPAILTMAAVTIAGLMDMTQPTDRFITAVLLIVFAVVMFAPYFWHGGQLRVHIAMGILSILVAAILTMSPGWNFFPILFFLMAPMAMIYLPVKTGLVWIAVFTLITAVIFVAQVGVSGLALLLPYAAGYVFFGIFGWMMVEADKNRARSEELLAKLQIAHQQLQEYTTRVEELAILQERNRIAREVHDSLGHRLTVASVQLEGAQRLVHTQPERAENIIGTVRDQVREGLAELRRTVALLRAPVAEDLPLSEALTRLASQFEEATGLAVHLDLEECPQNLTTTYRQTLYRTAQEGLTNIQRHAQARDAWLIISQRDGQITLMISDNGVGMPASSTQVPEAHFGLVGLKEKAALLEGEFYIDPRPGGGTQITLRLPALPQEAHE